MTLPFFSPTKTEAETKAEVTPLLDKSSNASPNSGYTYIFLSSCTGSAVSLLVHLVLTKYAFSIGASILTRATIPTVLAILILSRIAPPSPSRAQLSILAARGVLASSSVFCNYEALRRIPLGTNRTITATCPAMTSCFCAVFLGESLTPIEVTALLVSFIGIILVGHASQPAEHLYGSPWVGALFAVASAVFASGSSTLVRMLGTRVHPLHNVLALNIVLGLWCFALARGPDYEMVFTNRVGMMLMSVSSAIGFFGASMFVAGLQRCRGGPGLLISTTGVPVSYLLGFLVFGERCGWSGLIGALLIIGAAVAVGLSSALPNETPCRTGSEVGSAQDRTSTRKL